MFSLQVMDATTLVKIGLQTSRAELAGCTGTQIARELLPGKNLYTNVYVQTSTCGDKLFVEKTD